MYSEYIVYAPLTKVQISVWLDGRHIKGSPFRVDWNADGCSCPVTPAEFKEIYQCPAEIDKGLQEGLARYARRGFEEFMILEAAEKMKDINHAYIQYVVKDNKIYTKNHTEISGFKQFWDKAFLSLSNKVRLPDGEFLLNLGDWPLVRLNNPRHKDSSGQFFPMLSGCLDGESADIIIPTWVDTRYIFNEAIENILEVDAKSFSRGPFESKIPKLFWRGRDANAERLKLIELGRAHPADLDVGITNYFFFRDRERSLGRAPYTDFLDFWKYKYILNVDGTVAAYRLQAVLAGNSVVLKQDSKYVEWFYHHLRPYEHYIPVRHDLSDVAAQVAWAREHDEEVQRMARNARTVIREIKSPERIYCQLFQVLEEISKLMKYQVEVRPDMEFVKPFPLNYECKCPPKPKGKNKKKGPAAPQPRLEL